MKQLYFLLFFISFQLSFAQTSSEILLNNTWRLVSFDNECFGHGPIENGEFNPNNILLNFSEENGQLYFQTEMCQAIDGTVHINDAEIKFTITSTQGDPCEHPLNQQYEDGFQCAMSAEYHFTITEENGFYKLSLSNEIFMDVTFTTELLKTENLTQNFLSLYPNPVKEILNIENPDLKIKNLELLNSEGKIISQKAVNQKEIALDFNPFAKGIYYLKLRLENGRVQTEKIIKK